MIDVLAANFAALAAHLAAATCTVTGRPIGEDAAGQIAAVLDGIAAREA